MFTPVLCWYCNYILHRGLHIVYFFSVALVIIICRVPTSMNLYPKVKVDIVVSTVDPGLVVAAAQKAIGTEHRGSGKIFVSDVEDVMRVRTGETGYDALND